MIINRPGGPAPEWLGGETTIGSPLDAATVLDNLIELERLLDDETTRELASIPYLELSKHVRIRQQS